MFRGTLQERIVAPFILADPVIHLHYDKFLYYNIKFIVTRLINKISLYNEGRYSSSLWKAIEVVYDLFFIFIMSVLDLIYSLCYLVFIQYVNATSYFVGINHEF
jgi:hypothetical protein